MARLHTLESDPWFQLRVTQHKEITNRSVQCHEVISTVTQRRVGVPLRVVIGIVDPTLLRPCENADTTGFSRVVLQL